MSRRRLSQRTREQRGRHARDLMFSELADLLTEHLAELGDDPSIEEVDAALRAFAVDHGLGLERWPPENLH